MRYPSLAAVLLFCAGCAGTTTASLFNAQFGEIEDTDFTQLNPPGAPVLDRLRVENTGIINPNDPPSEVRIRNGKLILNSVANLDDALIVETAPSPSDARSVLYTWRGELTFVGSSVGFVRFEFLVRQTPRQPYRTMAFRFEKDEEWGLFNVIANGEVIGRLRTGVHSVVVAVDIEEQTYSFLVGAFGSASIGPIPLDGSVASGRTPFIEITPFGGSSGNTPVVEYEFEGINVIATQTVE